MLDPLLRTLAPVFQQTVGKGENRHQPADDDGEIFQCRDVHCSLRSHKRYQFVPLYP